MDKDCFIDPNIPKLHAFFEGVKIGMEGGREILDYKTIQQYIAIMVLSLVECIDRKALNCLFLRIGMCVIYNPPLYFCLPRLAR